MQPDALDILGGICTFSRPSQLYYATEALAWGGQPEATNTERIALEALNAYATATDRDRSFGHEAGARSALATARILQNKVDGAAEALAPVLDLPPSQRIHTIVISIEQVRTALHRLESPGRDAIELADAIEAFTSDCLARTR
ncbi:MAG: hypothetical protein ACRDTG_04980 [Pseudonocardiaceae bacterium]